MNQTSNQDDFRVDIGRAKKLETNEFCTFVRVLHVPSGFSRIVVGIGSRSANDVVDELATLLIEDVAKAEGNLLGVKDR